MNLRTPALTWERAKLSVVIVVYSLFAEYVDPAPFFQSFLGRLLFVTLVVEVTRQVWVYRLEVSAQHMQRAKDMRTRWVRLKEHFSVNARFRIRRVLYVLAGVWAFGFILNGMTMRCDSAVQCALLAPKLAVENLPMMLQVAFYMAMGMAQFGVMIYAMTKVGFVKIILPGTIEVQFSDVFGQDAAKAIIEEQIALLEYADAIEAAGGFMPKGVLIWGPPGTGKTMLASAAANASTKPLIQIPPGAFASTFVGINYLKVWMLFKLIRKLSLRHDGVIVFFDEIDSLGNRGSEVADQIAPEIEGCAVRADFSTQALPWRGPPESTNWFVNAINAATIYGMIVTGGGGMNMGTLEAFLSGMDGMDQPRGFTNKILALLGFQPMPAPKYRYLMIGATNRPDALDAALVRAGRFGRKVHMGYPKFEGRLHTFNGYLDRVDHTLEEDDIEWAARNLDRGTGASIKDIVNEGLLIAFRDDRTTITFQDLMDAMLWKALGEGEGMHEVDEDNWNVAVHEAGHAVVNHYLMGEYTKIWVGSIEKRGNYGGVIASTEIAERTIRTEEAVYSQMAVSLGSKVAEDLVLGFRTAGHAGDAPAASALAEKLIAGGMGSSLASIAPPYRDPKGFAEELELILRKGWTIAYNTLTSREDQIDAVAHLLIDEGGTVQGDKIHALLNEMENSHV